jgi:hypothetical protein
LELYWLLQAVGYWSLVVLIVPVNYIKKFLLYAILGGFLYTWIVQYLAVNVLRFWQFAQDIFMISGIPFFFVLSWFAVTFLYGYMLYQYPRNQLWIVLFFVFWATINNYVSISVNQITFDMWSLAHTFMFALFSHVILLYLLKVMHHVDELGAKEDIISFSLAVLKNKK